MSVQNAIEFFESQLKRSQKRNQEICFKKHNTMNVLVFEESKSKINDQIVKTKFKEYKKQDLIPNDNKRKLNFKEKNNLDIKNNKFNEGKSSKLPYPSIKNKIGEKRIGSFNTFKSITQVVLPAMNISSTPEKIIESKELIASGSRNNMQKNIQNHLLKNLNKSIQEEENNNKNFTIITGQLNNKKQIHQNIINIEKEKEIEISPIKINCNENSDKLQNNKILMEQKKSDSVPCFLYENYKSNNSKLMKYYIHTRHFDFVSKLINSTEQKQFKNSYNIT